MDMQHLIETYGYLALFIGTFLEGETIMVLSGLAAHHGFLDLYLVMLVGGTGTMIGDQFFFYMGRRHRNKPVVRFASLRDKIVRAAALLDRYRTPVMLGFRFLYGLRAVLPFVIGMGPVRFPVFFWLNLAGAVIWAVSVAYLGYFFGVAVQTFLSDLKEYEYLVYGGIALIGLAIWLVNRVRSRRRRAREIMD